jgi:hypothetical protein
MNDATELGLADLLFRESDDPMVPSGEFLEFR